MRSGTKLIGLSVAALVLALWMFWALCSTWVAQRLAGANDLSSAGQWGDSFGALNALISGFGFVAVIITLRSQLSSIKLQQVALKQQQDDLHRQRFESSFFELLRLLRESRDDVVRGDSVGIKAFVVSARSVINSMEEFGERKFDKNIISELYMQNVHSRFEAVLSLYFRLVYTMLIKIGKDFILDDKDKIFYGNLLRSQLSSGEIALIGFNGLLKISNDLPILICEFHLLKYLPEGDARTALEAVYPKSAFQGRDDGPAPSDEAPKA